MSATNYTPIQIYYSATTTNVPLAANLAAGELAINIADGKLFYKDSSNVVQILAVKGGVGSSSTTQVIYNSSGVAVGSANLTFNGTVLSSSFAGPVAATTLSASSTVSGTGFSTYLASPPAIGGTAAAAGSFTTLSASSTVSGTGFSNYFTSYLASPAAIGGTTPAAITGTTITANTSFAGALNGTVGATTPNSGAFTTLSSSGFHQVYAPSPGSITSAGIMSTSTLLGIIIAASGSSYTTTMPSGGSIESMLTWAGTNISFDFFIISTASGTITLANNSGVTIVGSTSILSNTSATFRIRRTAASTFIVYRIA